MVNETIRPRAWIGRGVLTGSLFAALEEDPRSDACGPWDPLYDQTAIDAALNLWPRDCRLCAHFTTKAGGCVSVVQCVDSMQFKATPPRQYWISLPNV